MVPEAQFDKFKDKIMALIVGIVAIPIAILAVVFGYFARKRGDSYGVTGLILGVITLLLIIAFVILTTPVYVESGFY